MDQAQEARLLLERLAAYRPFDATERRKLEQLIRFLETSPAPFARTTPAGHITASCFVTSADGASALLLHHAKLDRWLQPGGHCEPARDGSHLAATLRELAEETGLGGGEVALHPGIFDVDVHAIPERGGVPAHLHYDVRRHASHLAGSVRRDASEANALAWVPLAEIAASAEASLARMARKALLPDPR